MCAIVRFSLFMVCNIYHGTSLELEGFPLQLAELARPQAKVHQHKDDRVVLESLDCPVLAQLGEEVPEPRLIERLLCPVHFPI